MIILGIESSCDETAAAVLEVTSRKGEEDIEVKILSNVVSSQIKIHAKTGGVVPEVAAREHLKNILPVVEEALQPLMNNELRIKNYGQKAITHLPAGKAGNLEPRTSLIDAIAVTYGPGLITSLATGVETARTLAWAMKVPLVAVNHLAGHIAAARLQSVSEQRSVNSEQSLKRSGGTTHYSLLTTHYPALALVVSGGHTELVLMKKLGSYEVIGATRDDAVGEAFDKVAKILNLGYPGGPIVSKLAEQGDVNKIPFNPPMLNSNDFEFSFSGIKTAVLYRVRDQRSVNSEQYSDDRLITTHCSLSTQNISDICASFQKAVVEVLVAKTIRAADKYKVKTIMLAGGVAANKQLRQRLLTAIQALDPVPCSLLPAPCFCTDNAVMIALAGYFKAIKKEYMPWEKLEVDANLSL